MNLLIAQLIVTIIEQAAIKGPQIIDDFGLSEADAQPLKDRLTTMFQQKQWKTDDQIAAGQ